MSKTDKTGTSQARPAMRQPWVYPAIAGAVTALAFSAIFVKKLEALDVPAVVVAFYRVGLAALLLAPFTLSLKRRELAGLRRSEHVLLLLAGLCLAVHFGAWIASLEYIPVAESVVLVDSHPILVAIASYFLLGETLAARTVAGAVLGIIGTVIICRDGFRGAGAVLWGDALALLGACAMAGYLLVGRRIRGRVSLFAYATPVYAVCALFLLIWAGVSGSRVWGYGRSEWMLFAALALIPTILGHTVLNWALRHVPAIGISISFLGEPVVAALLAFVFLSQIPPATAAIGSALVLAGIYLTLARNRKPGRDLQKREMDNWPSAN